MGLGATIPLRQDRWQKIAKKKLEKEKIYIIFAKMKYITYIAVIIIATCAAYFTIRQYQIDENNRLIRQEMIKIIENYVKLI